MSGLDNYDIGAETLNADQQDALDQLHGWMAHQIADAHLTGDKDSADSMAAQRREISDEMAPASFAAVEPAPLQRDDRETLEDQRAALTRELHEAVANKDSFRAERLDRERGELTEGLYGNGEIVGAGGRSL